MALHVLYTLTTPAEDPRVEVHVRCITHLAAEVWRGSRAPISQGGSWTAPLGEEQLVDFVSAIAASKAVPK